MMLSAGWMMAMSASSAFAFSGLALVVVAVGWTVGPFKTPMVWSEGALVSYEGNTTAHETDRESGTWRLVAVPAFAFAAGLLLLAAAGLIATQ